MALKHYKQQAGIVISFLVTNILFWQLLHSLHLPPTIWPCAGFVAAGFLSSKGRFLGALGLGGLLSVIAIWLLAFQSSAPLQLTILFLLTPATQWAVMAALNKFFRVNDRILGLKANVDFVLLAITTSLVTASIKAFLDIGNFGVSRTWSWIAWCFADTAGMIIFAPYLMLLWGPRDLWKSRQRDLGLAGLFMVSMTAAMIGYTTHQSRKEEIYKLNLAAEHTMNQLNTVVNLAHSSLSMIESSSGLNSKLTYDVFARIAARALEINPMLRAMTWVPQIRVDQVRDFESKMTLELGHPFKLFERDTNGQVKALEKRPHYYPVSYIFPRESNTKAIGFDLASEPVRRDAIDKAVVSREAISTKPVKLVQDPDSRFGGILYFLPLRAAAPAQTPVQMYNVVVDLNRLFAPLMTLSARENVDFYIVDTDSQKIIGSNVDLSTRSDTLQRLSSELAHTSLLKIANQKWDIVFVKDLNLLPPKPESWLIICLSILLGSAMVVGVLVITGNTEELKTLLRALSHDIINPLAVIMGYAQKGKSEMTNAGHQVPAMYFAKILNSAENQRDLIEHFKMMRANADGKNALKLSKVPVSGVISQIEHTFGQKLEEKNIQLKINAPELKELHVLAEPTSLNHNVLNNLISNAIKFSHKGSTIEISAIKLSGQVQITVRDKGIGMPQELVRKVFRTDKHTSRIGTGGERGTGFGMPVAKAYMSRYGGEIEIDSRAESEYPEDHGTTVTLTFKSA